MRRKEFVLFFGTCLLFLAACTNPPAADGLTVPAATTVSVSDNEAEPVAVEPTLAPTDTAEAPLPPPTETPAPPTITPEPDLNTALVADYHFAGDLLDSSGNENHGSEFGEVSFTADRFGNPNQALALDGIDDYISIPHSPSIGLTFRGTLSAWVYHAGQPEESTYYTIFEKSDPERGGHSRYGLWLFREGVTACIEPTDNSIQRCLDSESLLAADEWVHITATYNGETMMIYFNGELQIEKTFPLMGISSSPYEIFIGTDPYGGPTTPFTEMMIDDMRVYRRDLAPEEVVELFELAK